MNERIHTLYKEALKFAYKNVPRDNWNTGVFHPIVSGKFAELIISEGAGIYSKIDNGNLHMGTDDYLEALDKLAN